MSQLEAIKSLEAYQVVDYKIIKEMQSAPEIPQKTATLH